MFDYNFVSSWALDLEGKPIEKEFFDKLTFTKSLQFLNLDETIYCSLLDLKLHT